MSQNVIAAQRLWLTADKEAVVADGDERAASLYAAEGDEIPAEMAEKFGLIDGALPGFDAEAIAAEMQLNFYRKGLDEFLNGLGNVQYPALLLQNYSYRLSDTSLSDNRMKSRNIGFLVIDNCTDMDNYARIDEIFTEMESIADDIVKRIQGDGNYTPVALVQDFSAGSVEGVQVMNYADGNYGVFISLTITSSFF